MVVKFAKSEKNKESYKYLSERLQNERIIFLKGCGRFDLESDRIENFKNIFLKFQ